MTWRNDELEAPNPQKYSAEGFYFGLLLGGFAKAMVYNALLLRGHYYQSLADRTPPTARSDTPTGAAGEQQSVEWILMKLYAK